MKTYPWIVCLTLVAALTVGAQGKGRNTCRKPSTEKADKAYFEGKHKMLTAVWDQPFGYKEIRSNNAPKGPYLGNGDVGIVAHTSADSLNYQISKVDFVTDRWSDWAGAGAAALPVGGLRIAIHSSRTQDFLFQMDQLKAELRMESGTREQVKARTWMTMGDNYVVTELSTRSPFPVRISVDTYAQSGNPRYGTSARISGAVGQVSRRTNTVDNARWVSRAGISTRVIGAETVWSRTDDSNVHAEFQLSSQSPVWVVSYVSGGGKDDNARWDIAESKLKVAGRSRLVKWEREKNDWWKEMWTRSYVETGDSLINRHYLSSIYLLASAYNGHSPACGGMYGVWNMEDDMQYHGDIHLNYNSQAGFYSMYSSNRPELSLPFCDFVEKMIPEGRERAKTDMGNMHPSWKGKSCRGVLFPVSALGIGSFYGVYWQQTMNAPFCMPFFSWYYEYTGDKRFLREYAYPYIREIGDFYEDYIYKEDFGDSYRYCIMTGGHEGSWDLNPPSDLGFVEQCFRLLIKYSEILGVDEDRRVLWRDIVTHMPEYKVIMPTKEPNEGKPVYAKNEAGWDWPAHVIQLHPVYPCELINLRSDPKKLEIARNTLQYYSVSQRGFTETMNELGLSAFIMGARIGFPADVLMDKMKVLIKRAEPNFLIRDGHHCTEKTAVVETVNSMMLQSVDDILYLFPDWTGNPASFTRLRAKGAFVVSAAYDGTTVRSLSVTSECGRICRLRNPWPGSKVVVKCNGKRIEVSEADGVCSFATKAGGHYQVSH